MSSTKPFRIRVRVVDGKPRKYGPIKAQLGMTYVEVIDAKQGGLEFVIRADKEAHLDQVRAKLAAAGLEEVAGGDTSVEKPGPAPAHRSAGRQPHGGPRPQPRSPGGRDDRRAPARQVEALRPKPYGFVPLPEQLSTAAPAWHDGTSSAGRLSGEVRFELENLTPLLVGWERREVGDDEGPWPVPAQQAQGADLRAFVDRAARQAHPDPRDDRQQRAVDRARSEYASRLRNAVVELPGAGRTVTKKSLLCPLRTPWGMLPVVIPGDSLKGLLRHELGALLGAPMERVAERSHAYRPNLKFPDRPAGRRLEPRLARVKARGVTSVNGASFPVPQRIDVLRMTTRDQQCYYPRRLRDGRIEHAPAGTDPYRGGLGGGQRLPDACLSPDARRRMIHTNIDKGEVDVERQDVQVPNPVLAQYARTLEHLLSDAHGHFSGRHPNVGTNQQVRREAISAVQGAAHRAFQAGDLIWVEWDTMAKSVVSFGWHYYYRWAYQDTVRLRASARERDGLFPLPAERGDVPSALSPVRRLFGYTRDNDNDGSRGIGAGDHEQLMGRVSVNAALEDVPAGTKDEERFLPPVFLKELGMPRPSAVEHYLRQPYHPRPRPSDRATLVTYGDASGYDEPGELAGRKFYLDRADAYTSEPWKDDSEANRLNDRSTLALDASRPGRRFRFTLRFRDADPEEVAAILLAYCPDQFAQEVGGMHADGYCSKLGYARPLGWGSVRIVAKELHLLDWTGPVPTLTPAADVLAWFRAHAPRPPVLAAWLAIHRRRHPEAGDYPRGADGQIYTYHTSLRAEHTRWRRYDEEGTR